MAEVQAKQYPEFSENGLRKLTDDLSQTWKWIKILHDNIQQIQKDVTALNTQIGTFFSAEKPALWEDRLNIIEDKQQRLEEEITQMGQKLEGSRAEIRQIVDDVWHETVNLKKEPEPTFDQDNVAAGLTLESFADEGQPSPSLPEILSEATEDTNTIQPFVLEQQGEEPKAAVEVEELKATVQELSQQIQELKEQKSEESAKFQSRLEMLEKQNTADKPEILEEPKRQVSDTPERMLPVELIPEPSADSAKESEAIATETQELEWMAALVDRLYVQYQEQFTADQRDYQKSYSEWEFWRETCAAVDAKLPLMMQAAEQLLSEMTISENLSENCYKLAEARLKSLETLRKMTLRLEDKREPLKVTSSEFGALEEVSKMALGDALKGQSDIDSAKRRLLGFLEEKGNDRYAVIKSVEDAAGRRRKAVTNFIERSLLPIADGLEEGCGYTEELKAKAGDEAELLPDFTGAYKSLLSHIEELIDAGGVEKISIAPGDPANFLCMEPVDMEPDETFGDEAVKRVSRAGYRLRENLPVSQAKAIMRNAQIVVVKN